MYIYFKSLNVVLTCEEYPQLLSVNYVKDNKLEYLCNKWQKNDTNDNKFTLSYKYEKITCNCDNSQYTQLKDYNIYECYNCGREKSQKFLENTDLYLQNSGSIDVVCVKPQQSFCELCNVDNYQNVYKWTDTYDENLIFALHIENGMLSDRNVKDKIDNNKDLYQIIFTETI